MDRNDKRFMHAALTQAQKSVGAGGFPAGAVVVQNGTIIARGISVGHAKHDPSGHAETTALRKACAKLTTTNLAGATLYESLECCAMCFSVAYWAGISKIVFAVQKTPALVAKGYYEGTTENRVMNDTNNRRIELVFAPEFEAASRAIIDAWEQKGGFGSAAQSS